MHLCWDGTVRPVILGKNRISMRNFPEGSIKLLRSSTVNYLQQVSSPLRSHGEPCSPATRRSISYSAFSAPWERRTRPSGQESHRCPTTSRPSPSGRGRTWPKWCLFWMRTEKSCSGWVWSLVSQISFSIYDLRPLTSGSPVPSTGLYFPNLGHWI